MKICFIFENNILFSKIQINCKIEIISLIDYFKKEAENSTARNA